MAEDKRTAPTGIMLEDLDYQVRLVMASFETRIFSIIVALICAIAIKNTVGVVFPREIWAVFTFWLATSVVYFLAIRSNYCRNRRCLENLHLSYYVPGVFFSTLLVHYLGGAEWIAFFIYLFDLIYANVLMRRIRGFLVTLYVLASYFTLIWAEYKGLIPHRMIFDPAASTYDNYRYLFVTNYVIVGAVILLISYTAGLFSKMKEDREKSLSESKNRLLAKSERLEDMARTLKMKVAENVYIKRATIGYIEKKEFELQQTKKDLEDQIDKLRKTQKAMFFMIEDLNEMSAQLKDARDHLEDKVRERTDELLNISRKLHRSERLAFLGKLAGSVTHELRNPLAVLKNAAYYLDKRFSEEQDGKVRKYMDIMKKEITIIDSIIDDIMGFAKTRPPEVEEVDIADVIENALSTINVPELVEVKKEYGDLPKVHIDSNQVMHAVMNIANNAIMAMNGNGILTFRTFKTGDNICVEIKDTGPGIPPDQRDLIFEPLYSSKPKGTGLGLPIAKMMIENQEGRIQLESELGEGTAFRICLPLNRKTRGQKSG